MRRRITFVQPDGSEIDGNAFNVSRDGIQLQDLRATREDRLTAGLYELPQEARLSHYETRTFDCAN